MQTLQIAAGFILILVTFLDFFHTTLSGNGFGAISRLVNRTLNRIIIQNRSRTIFNYSGVTHLLITTIVWLVLLFLGAYIIFTAGQDMVINETSKLARRLRSKILFYSICAFYPWYRGFCSRQFW